jgi:hypothetical protein
LFLPTSGCPSHQTHPQDYAVLATATSPLPLLTALSGAADAADAARAADAACRAATSAQACRAVGADVSGELTLIRAVIDGDYDHLPEPEGPGAAAAPGAGSALPRAAVAAGVCVAGVAAVALALAGHLRPRRGGAVHAVGEMLASIVAGRGRNAVRRPPRRPAFGTGEGPAMPLSSRPGA